MAGEKEVAAAYRELAKRWHPDQGGGEEAVRRMAEINAAFDLLRADAAHQAPPRKPPRGRRRGSWLPDAVRRALGPELLEALSDREAVKFVTPVSTWASPRAVLAVTERRLLCGRQGTWQRDEPLCLDCVGRPRCTHGASATCGRRERE